MGKIKPETVVSLVLIGAASIVSLGLWCHSFSYESEYEQYGENKIMIMDDDNYSENLYKKSVKITCDGDELKISGGGGARADKKTAYIASGGCYTISGELENIVISTSDSTPVMLELDGAVIESKKQPPIYAARAAKVVISSAPESENYITDSRVRIGNSNVSSAIYSVSDITFNGEGKITVEGNYSDAVKTDGILKIMSGYVGIIADDDGTTSRSAIIKNGKTSVTSTGDAIKAEADRNTGLIAIDGGKVIINTENGDGLYSTGDIYINNIDADIVTGDGSNGSSDESQNDSESMTAPGNQPTEVMPGGTPPGGMPPGGAPPGPPPDEPESAEESESDLLPSTKGIKADKNLYVNGGNLVLDTGDDGLHTGGAIVLKSGIVKIASGDDAIHADGDLLVNGGILTITDCYEGLESKYMVINSGDIKIFADDDGINVSGTSSMMTPPPNPGDAGIDFTVNLNNAIDEENAKPDFVMNGGKLCINSRGDGIDINSSCEINGGYITALALQDGPENSFDFDGICKINGGHFFGTGNPNMAVFPSEISKCNSLVVYPPQIYKGGVVRIAEQSGEVLIEKAIDGTIGWIGLYGEKLIEGKTYTISVNGKEIANTLISERVTIVECETADGNTLPGGPPPGMMEGEVAGAPPGAPPGVPPGVPTDEITEEQSIAPEASGDVIDSNTLASLKISGIYCVLILISIFAVKLIKRKY